jgi:hypothetical protein
LEITMGETVGKMAMGGLFLIAGVGVGYMMFLQPEGLNPEWGLWAAEVAPAMFALAGIYLISDALGYPRFALRLLQVLLVVLLLMLHWITFFVTGGECTATFSFLGLSVLTEQLDPVICRWLFMVAVAVFDVIFIALPAFLALRRWRNSRGGAAATPP